MASPTRMKFFKETNCNQKNYFCSPNGKRITLLANSCWSTKTVFASFQIGVPFWSTSHIFSVFPATNYAYVRGTLLVIPHIWYSGDLNTGLLIRFRSWMSGDLNVRDLNVWGPECPSWDLNVQDLKALAPFFPVFRPPFKTGPFELDMFGPLE